MGRSARTSDGHSNERHCTTITPNSGHERIAWPLLIVLVSRCESRNHEIASQAATLKRDRGIRPNNRSTSIAILTFRESGALSLLYVFELDPLWTAEIVAVVARYTLLITGKMVMAPPPSVLPHNGVDTVALDINPRHPQALPDSSRMSVLVGATGTIWITAERRNPAMSAGADVHVRITCVSSAWYASRLTAINAHGHASYLLTVLSNF